MGFQIDDGSGDGYSAAVDSSKKLMTRAVTNDSDQHVNADSGKGWSIPFEDLNPDGNDDYVVYIKNTGDKVIHISDLRVAATAATQLEIHRVSGTVAGGTTITPVSYTAGSSATMSATVESGTDLTGLTNEGIFYFVQCAVANTEYHLISKAKIRIPKGQAIALLVETGTANITGNFSVFEEE